MPRVGIAEQGAPALQYRQRQAHRTQRQQQARAGHRCLATLGGQEIQAGRAERATGEGGDQPRRQPVPVDRRDVSDRNDRIGAGQARPLVLARRKHDQRIVGRAGHGWQHAQDVDLAGLFLRGGAPDHAVGGQRFSIPVRLAGGAQRQPQGRVARPRRRCCRQLPAQPVRPPPTGESALIQRLPGDVARWRGGDAVADRGRGHVRGGQVHRSRRRCHGPQPGGDRDKQHGEGGQGAEDVHAPILSAAWRQWSPAGSCSAGRREICAAAALMLEAPAHFGRPQPCHPWSLP
ncbi:hypothetical protein D3C71_702620 [compost metagenome]